MLTHIAGCFNDQCLRKEKDKVLDFLFRDSYQRKIETKHTQPDPYLPRLFKSTISVKGIDERV